MSRGPSPEYELVHSAWDEARARRNEARAAVRNAEVAFGDAKRRKYAAEEMMGNGGPHAEEALAIANRNHEAVEAAVQAAHEEYQSAMAEVQDAYDAMRDLQG